MKQFTPLVFMLLLTASPAEAASGKIEKDLITFQGKQRAYYLFVPETVKASTSVPLIVLLHGSGRNGLSLVEKWDGIAKKEGIILAGPDSSNSSQWSSPADGPDFLHELIETLKSKYPINPRRVYLFGHSAGASFALQMSLLESEYFAATAIHAGALPPSAYSLFDHAGRKIPLAIQVGTNDQFFPLAAVRATRDELKKRGFPVELTEIAKHDHWYYDLAPKINQSAWDFLKNHELSADPRYEQYRFDK
jgi:poly(3-hydroxybutyrate) depolymerase